MIIVLNARTSRGHGTKLLLLPLERRRSELYRYTKLQTNAATAKRISNRF